MAKISEEHIVVKVSQLVKDDESAASKVTDEIKETIETVVAELVGDDCVIEVINDE